MAKVTSNIDARKVSNEEWLAASFYQMPAAWRKGASNGNAVARRRYNAAYFKFTDTTFGGSDVVNPRHQYTKFADPPIKGIAAASEGMGEWYSSTIDDHKQKVHIGPGLPAFNSMLGYAKNFYEAETGHLVNTGRGSSLSFKAGAFLGGVSMVAGTAAIAGTAGLAVLGLVAGVGYGVSLTKSMYRYLAEAPSSKYYYLKPSAELYWNAVSNIMNTLCVYTGLVEKPHLPGTSRIDTSGLFYEKEDAAKFRKYMPDLFREDGSIDVFRLSRKAQILSDKSRDNLEALTAAEGTDYDTRGSSRVLATRMRNYLNAKISDSGVASAGRYSDSASIDFLGTGESSDERNDNTSKLVSELNTTNDTLTMNAYLQSYLDSELGKMEGTSLTNAANGESVADTTGNENNPENNQGPDNVAGYSAETLDEFGAANKTALNGYEDSRSLFKQMYDSVTSMAGDIHDLGRADARGGADFVTYHVDYAGAVQESFSNSAGETGIGSQLKGIASTAKQKRIDFAEGNIGGEGGFTGMVQGVVSGLMNGVAGFASAWGLDGLIALSGKGFADIPKVWQDTAANLPRMSYSIELRAVYGHRYDIMTNIFYPLATLLAFVLPRSTGKQSYTQPFLVRCFDKGRAVCRTGLMTELSISRGEGNVAWNDDLLPMSVNVSFTIEDLSSVLHMPIAPMLSVGDLLVQTVGAGVGGAVDLVSGSDTKKTAEMSGKDTGKHVANLLTTGNWDDDNAFTDYMSALASLDITDMINATNRLKLRMATRVTAYNTQMSASYFSNQFHGTLPGRALQAYANQGMQGG